MDLRLDGKVALVTGSAQGIGFAVASVFAESGASVALLDVSEPGANEAARRIGGNARPYPVDRAAAESGGMDIAVNCAGRGTLFGLLQDEDPVVWRDLIDLNLLGTIYVSHAVIPHLIERGSGRIINIASDAARTGSAGEAVYSAAKGGVISLTKSLARELARHTITVNCVSPGPTDTPMLRRFAVQDESVIQKLIKATPLRRLGEPGDIGAAVLFLASDQAAHITGQVLSVSGGLTMA
jgi:2-hydroxycyclohexanecarboxyl-CoA dehydrogenase